MDPQCESHRRELDGDAAVLEAVGISRSYDQTGVPALDGVDLRVTTGEFVAIVGPSGCGKTTLLQILGTLDEPTSGELFILGKAVDDGFDRQACRARDIGFVFQSFHLLPTFTALENVQFPMLETAQLPKERKDRARDLLRLVGLEDREDFLPSKLSGGQRQRVAVARSLANHPSVLLADEPTGNLDSGSSDLLMDLLWRINREHRMTILLVTHNPDLARRADRQIHMRDGKICSDTGPASGKAR